MGLMMVPMKAREMELKKVHWLVHEMELVTEIETELMLVVKTVLETVTKRELLMELRMVVMKALM